MRIRVAHISLQFSDSDRQHTEDIEKIFDRAVARKYAWVMGTEAAPSADNAGKELIRIGRAHGYKVWVPSEQGSGSATVTDCWLAVREDLVVSNWKPGYTPVIPGAVALYKEAGLDEDLKPRWAPKGMVTVTFKSIPELGNIGLVVTHHLTQGRKKGKQSVVHGIDHYKWNQKLDNAIGEWVAEEAKGDALAFGSMDRNASDRRDDAEIPGATTLGDELRKWQNSGHGDIDWIFSVNKDGRVKGQNFVVLNDREFHLHGDHFLTEGTFNVEPLKR